MLGFIDSDNRAFLTLDFGQGSLDFLIDTGFDGSLVVGEDLFDASRAEYLGVMQAELASLQEFEYQQYLAVFEWLGEDLMTNVLVGAGKECLLGTALLNPHRLQIDYERRTVELIRASRW